MSSKDKKKKEPKKLAQDKSSKSPPGTLGAKFHCNTFKNGKLITRVRVDMNFNPMTTVSA